MKPVRITITNYSSLNVDYRSLIAPYYTIDNKDGQWIAKLKELLITALQTLAYDTIEESNVSSSTVTFVFKDKDVNVYQIECSK